MIKPRGDELVCVGGESVHPFRDQGKLGQEQGRGGAEEHQEEQAAASGHLFQVDTFTFPFSLQTPCETHSLYWLSSTSGPPLAFTFLVITFTFKWCVELSGNNSYEINDL